MQFLVFLLFAEEVWSTCDLLKVFLTEHSTVWPCSELHQGRQFFSPIVHFARILCTHFSTASTLFACTFCIVQLSLWVDCSIGIVLHSFFDTSAENLFLLGLYWRGTLNIILSCSGWKKKRHFVGKSTYSCSQIIAQVIARKYLV